MRGTGWSRGSASLQRGTSSPVPSMEGVTVRRCPLTPESGLQALVAGDTQEESWRATWAPLAFPPPLRCQHGAGCSSPGSPRTSTGWVRRPFCSHPGSSGPELLGGETQHNPGSPRSSAGGAFPHLTGQACSPPPPWSCSKGCSWGRFHINSHLRAIRKAKQIF